MFRWCPNKWNKPFRICSNSHQEDRAGTVPLARQYRDSRGQKRCHGVKKRLKKSQFLDCTFSLVFCLFHQAGGPSQGYTLEHLAVESLLFCLASILGSSRCGPHRTVCVKSFHNVFRNGHVEWTCKKVEKASSKELSGKDNGGASGPALLRALVDPEVWEAAKMGEVIFYLASSKDLQVPQRWLNALEHLRGTPTKE